MAKNWTEDGMLVDAITGNLFEALPLLPKRLVRVDAITRKFDMPFSHVQILCMLAEGSMTIGDISRSLGIAKPNITPLVDALCEEGLVERIRDMLDRRVVNVHLLPAGQERLAALQDSMMDQVDQWAGKLSRSELREMNNALASILRILEAVRENS